MEAAALALLLLRRSKAAESHHPEAALITAVHDTVLHARQVARDLGRETVAVRFGVASIVDPTTRLLDSVRAQQIARKHLDDVRAKVAEARAAAEPEPWKRALAETEWRAKTIAATETASAANAERIDAARDVQEALGIELLKEWNAEGEACPECISMDGETAPVDGSFSNGLDPGSAHPNCACWVEILTKTNSRAA